MKKTVTPAAKAQAKARVPNLRKAHKPQRGVMRKESPNSVPGMRTITLGSVSVTAAEPTEAQVLASVQASQGALQRVLEGLATPGVELAIPEHVPMFRASPDHPGYLIRRLHGKSELGQMIEGQFEVANP